MVSIEADPKISEYSATWFGGNENRQILAGFAFLVWRLDPTIGVSAFDSFGGSLGGNVEIKRRGHPDTNIAEGIYDPSRICSETEMRPNVLICDIEGAESVFLDQTPEWPLSIDDVLMEIHPNKLTNGDKDANLVCAIIKSKGFSLCEVIAMSYWFSRVVRPLYFTVPIA